jgi:hypothetical protein
MSRHALWTLHFGLRNMHERAGAIERALGLGTQVPVRRQPL